MILLAQITGSETSTFLAGIGGYTIVTILHGVIRDRFNSKRERTKVGELTQQTQLSGEQRDSLKKLVELAEEDKRERKKNNKKFLKWLKRTHQEVIIVKEQTKPKSKK